MKYLLAAAVLAAGLSGVSAGSAMADKTTSSDPAPKMTVPKATTRSYSRVVYCNRAGTKCVRALGYRSGR
jgi:hypothetical protein